MIHFHLNRSLPTVPISCVLSANLSKHTAHAALFDTSVADNAAHTFPEGQQTMILGSYAAEDGRKIISSTPT
jgi:hypothetical protein